MPTVTDPHDRAALVAADTARLGELLADDFILVSVEDGSVVPRSTLLDAVSCGLVTFPAVQSFPEAVVRRVGDVGIVVGRTSMKVVNSDGTAFAAGSRYAHIFTADPTAGWRLISAQGTRITFADTWQRCGGGPPPAARASSDGCCSAGVRRQARRRRGRVPDAAAPQCGARRGRRSPWRTPRMRGPWPPLRRRV
jgi:ketosteroid isomerase-like protein